MDPLEILGQFGLSRQEAQLYLVLLAEGPLSGYEAAKVTGISRSNAYAALASLVAQGAAYLEDGATPRYAPLAAEEFTRHRLRTLASAAEALVPLLPPRRARAEGYLTIVGAEAVRQRMLSMVEGARLRLYLSLTEAALAPLVPALAQAAARGVALTVLSPTDPGLPGATYRAFSPPEGQVRLIADSTEVLTGDGADPACLYSRRPALVALFKQALGNEIRLLDQGASL